MRCLTVCLLLIGLAIAGSSSEVDSFTDILPDGEIPVIPPDNAQPNPQEPVTIIGSDISYIDVDQIISYVMAARLNNAAFNNTSMISTGLRV